MPAAGRAVRVSQFIVTGAGLPREPYLHDEIRAADPSARVVYADSDPLALFRLREAAEEWGDGIAVAEGDVTGPEAVLSAAAPGGINLGEPVAVVLAGVLSSLPAEQARDAAKAFMVPLVPGSALVASCIHYDDRELADRMIGMSAPAGSWQNHSRDDIASFFETAGLRVVRGRIGDVHCWPLLPEKEEPTAVIGGVGIKGA